MRGRKPKPSSQRRLDGNASKTAINRDEPHHPPPADVFDAVPAELAGAETAAKEWVRLAPLLRRAKQVSDVDRSTLIALCLEWGRYLDAMSKVGVLGMVVKAPSGYPITNPYLPIATKALSACAKLWPELGLTPSSRSRVRAESGPGPTNDAFEEFDTPVPLPSTH